MMPDHRAAGPPSHVLMTTDLPTGAFDPAVELCRGLAEAGITVTLAVVGPAPSQGQRQEAEAIEGVQLAHRPGRLEWMAGGIDEVTGLCDWLADLRAATGADL